jgi:hypothetical protein
MNEDTPVFHTLTLVREDWERVERALAVYKETVTEDVEEHAYTEALSAYIHFMT